MLRKCVQSKIGRVIRVKTEKTAIVQVAHRHRHRLLRKEIIRRKNFMVHDEANEANLGDIVQIQHSGGKISNRKSWEIVSMIHKEPFPTVKIPEWWDKDIRLREKKEKEKTKTKKKGRRR